MKESTSHGDIKRVELFKKFVTCNAHGVQELGTWYNKLTPQFMGSQWMQHINPTTWSRVLLEKLLVPWLVKKFPTLYGIWRFITVFTTACHLCLSWAKWIQSKHSHPIPLTFGTGVLHLIQINHQPDATIFQLIILTFV